VADPRPACRRVARPDLRRLIQLSVLINMSQWNNFFRPLTEPSDRHRSVINVFARIIAASTAYQINLIILEFTLQSRYHLETTARKFLV
jgi:hypothetical protein